MSVGQYLISYLILCIPIAGFIMMLMWAFGSNVNINKKNWMRATFIWGIIIAVLYIIFAIVFAAAIASLYKSSYSYTY